MLTLMQMQAQALMLMLPDFHVSPDYKAVARHAARVMVQARP
jgi:hypothetical protein